MNASPTKDLEASRSFGRCAVPEYDMVRVPDKRAGTKQTHPYWRKGGKEMKEPGTITSLAAAASFVGWSLEIGAGR